MAAPGAQDKHRSSPAGRRVSGILCAMPSRACTTRLACTTGLACAVVLLAGCSSTRVDGVWADPEFAGRSLRGATVWVGCKALDATMARLCEERLSVELAARGAVPVRTPGSEPVRTDEAFLAAARQAAASVLVSATLMSGGVVGSPYGPTIGIGIGGIGGSGGHGGFGIGGGFSFPLGGVTPIESTIASTSVLEVSSGRPMWSMRASSSASADLGSQIAELARTTVDAMGRAGLL